MECTMCIYCLEQVNTLPGAVVPPEHTDRCWEHHSHPCNTESWSNLQGKPRPAKEKWAGTTTGTPEGGAIPRTNLGLTPFSLCDYFSFLLFQMQLHWRCGWLMDYWEGDRAAWKILGCGDLGHQWGRLSSKEQDQASKNYRSENSHKLENNLVSLMEKMRLSEAAMTFYANVLMKHKKRHISDDGCKWDICIMFVCRLGCSAMIALEEGQAVLLKVSLKNVLPSETKGRDLYSLFSGK